MKKVFKMPNAVKITGRSSSITNSFVNGVIPVIQPTEQEILKALSILEMDTENVCCAYCGDPMTEWDHFRPLVIGKQPTGYITEIHNLVPACSKCNQSKGNSNWKTWMKGLAEQSPATRGITNLEHRIKLLEDFEKWDNPKHPIKINIKGIIGEEKWKEHWANCNKIIQMMKDSQELSDEIKNDIKKHLGISKSVKSMGGSNGQHTKKGNGIGEAKKIGQIVRSDFINLVQKKGAPVVKGLCDKKYSKDMFDVNYPILIEISVPEDYEKRYDGAGYTRYYKNEYFIDGKRYLLTSQWVERNRKHLEKWIDDNK